MKLERPVVDNAWERQVGSLRIASRFSCRKVVRITNVKGHNMHSPERYAELIKLAMPEFIEVKGYSHVGDSQKRLPREAMPLWPDVKAWAREIAKSAGYIYADEFEHARVVLLCRDGKLLDGVMENIAKSEYPNCVSPDTEGEQGNAF